VVSQHHFLRTTLKRLQNFATKDIARSYWRPNERRSRKHVTKTHFRFPSRSCVASYRRASTLWLSSEAVARSALLFFSRSCKLLISRSCRTAASFSFCSRASDAAVVSLVSFSTSCFSRSRSAETPSLVGQLKMAGVRVGGCILLSQFCLYYDSFIRA
jgi:hypothetical protein